MSTRVRYTKTGDNMLISKSFKTPIDEVVVTITKEGTWAICNLAGEFKAGNLDLNELNVAKKAAKKALITLGCNFEAEVRPRTKVKAFDTMFGQKSDDPYAPESDQ